ncbi:unnamed protein product, partial [Symbiodinium microadriaticum]
PWFETYEAAVNWCIVNGRANFTERIIRLALPTGSRFMVNTSLSGFVNSFQKVTSAPTAQLQAFPEAGLGDRTLAVVLLKQLPKNREITINYGPSFTLPDVPDIPKAEQKKRKQKNKKDDEPEGGAPSKKAAVEQPATGGGAKQPAGQDQGNEPPEQLQQDIDDDDSLQKSLD